MADPIIKTTMKYTAPGGCSLFPGEHDSVTVTTTRASGGSGPGFTIAWRKLIAIAMPCAQIKMYSEGWSSLVELSKIFDWLGTLEDASPQPAAIMAGLANLGVERSRYSDDPQSGGVALIDEDQDQS